MTPIILAARSVAEKIKLEKKSEVLVVSHIDADGITSASIATFVMENLGIEYQNFFVKNLDEDILQRIGDMGAELVWYTDIGSSVKDKIEGVSNQAIITDHHTVIQSRTKSNNGRVFELNPHNFGIDGGRELSGSGITWIMAYAILGESVERLVPLAVTGAVGDLQDNENRALVGINKKIADIGESAGYVKQVTDIFYYGKETRPVYKMLQYAFDPVIPGISGNESAGIEFLTNLGVELRDDEGVWRSWVNLSGRERRLIISQIVRRILFSDCVPEDAVRVVGECYYFPLEHLGTEIHEAKEFATLLNACGRYGEAYIGLDVCLGDRGEAFRRARVLLRGHRRTLVESLDTVLRVIGIEEYGTLLYFHGGNKILDTIIGTLASMLLNSGEIPTNKPIIAFAKNTEGKIKVSARAPRPLINMGINLAQAVRIAADTVGGEGGGHSAAAGATIPEGAEDVFLREVEKIINKQLGNG
ncbi:MAG: recombinase RecJ [Thermoplasmata archaeon]|nr:MAG: recombinase RecJ [Thermoplasmata archaeon]